VLMDASPTAIFFIVQVVVDLLLITLVVYWFYYRAPRREKTLSTLFEHLETLVTSSDAAVRRFEDSLKRDQADIKKLIRQQEQHEERMRNLIRDAETLLERIERERLLLIQSGSRPGSGTYEEVLTLLEKGMSVADISEQTGVPMNEIQLLLDVRR